MSNKIEFKIEMELTMLDEKYREQQVKSSKEILEHSRPTKAQREYLVGVINGLNSLVDKRDEKIEDIKISREAEIKSLANPLDIQNLKQIRSYLTGLLTNGSIGYDAVNHIHLSSLSNLIYQLESKI